MIDLEELPGMISRKRKILAVGGIAGGLIVLGSGAWEFSIILFGFIGLLLLFDIHQDYRWRDTTTQTDPFEEARERFFASVDGQESKAFGVAISVILIAALATGGVPSGLFAGPSEAEISKDSCSQMGSKSISCETVTVDVEIGGADDARVFSPLTSYYVPSDQSVEVVHVEYGDSVMVEWTNGDEVTERRTWILDQNEFRLVEGRDRHE